MVGFGLSSFIGYLKQELNQLYSEELFFVRTRYVETNYQQLLEFYVYLATYLHNI